jgi:hypothetical protein
MNKYILWPARPEIRTRLIKSLEDLPLDKTWEVTVKPYVSKKTAEQRSWFHVLCKLFGDEIGMPQGNVKEIAKAQLCGWKEIEYGGIKLVIADGHSEKLSLNEYSNLIEVLYQMAGEAGIVLPPPRSSE